MELAKLNLYCQFCLREQTDVHPKERINKTLKENFFKITQKKVQ